MSLTPLKKILNVEFLNISIPRISIYTNRLIETSFSVLYARKCEYNFGSVRTLLVGEYIYAYVCVYMFIFTELIEKTGRSPGLIFGMC